MRDEEEAAVVTKEFAQKVSVAKTALPQTVEERRILSYACHQALGADRARWASRRGAKFIKDLRAQPKSFRLTFLRNYARKIQRDGYWSVSMPLARVEELILKKAYVTTRHSYVEWDDFIASIFGDVMIFRLRTARPASLEEQSNVVALPKSH